MKTFSFIFETEGFPFFQKLKEMQIKNLLFWKLKKCEHNITETEGNKGSKICKSLFPQAGFDPGLQQVS